MPMPHAAPVPDTEPYPSELPRIRDAFEKLSKRFVHTRLTDANLDCFLRAAADLFAEAGFLVSVGLDEVYKNGVRTGWFLPEVTITGRIHKELETDHDRLQYEVVRGMADGQPGYIRADGTKREDPIKKLIV